MSVLEHHHFPLSAASVTPDNARSQARICESPLFVPGRFGRTGLCRGISWVLWGMAGLMGLMGNVASAGTEVSGRDEDIVVQVDSRWPGCRYGGYFPLRIKLTNLGETRDLVLVFEPTSRDRDAVFPTVRRAIRIDQQATLNLTLSVPVVAEGTSGQFEVRTTSGRSIKGLSSRHEVNDTGNNQPRPSLLVISSNSVDDKAVQPFENAASTWIANAAPRGSSSWSHGYRSSSMTEVDHVVIQPARNLPVNWIDYSGVDLVATDWTDWRDKLSNSEREAILKWTATGGVLIFFQTGKPAAQLAELKSALQLTDREISGWTPADPDRFRKIRVVTAEEIRNGASSMPMHMHGSGSTPAGVASHSSPEEVSNEHWQQSADTFSYRDWSQGRIYVFPGNPFPGTVSSWAWLMTSMPSNLLIWPDKMGISAREEQNEFLNFLIPGIGTVPVFAFLTLITLFTVLIGPLNYYWLRKQRRLGAMVFTVPLIAGVTCLLLFAYSLIADGFSTRSRVHSVTWLDQTRKSAVSISRISLYAPFAPSSGLSYSPECAVFPIWRRNGKFENGIIDWSGNDQRLTSGWFRSQTWTQFLTVDYKDQRGRLDFTPPSSADAQELDVSNGLEWDLNYLLVKVTDEAWFAGEKVPAGATARLKRLQPAEVSAALRKQFEGHEWELPKGVENDNPNDYWNTLRRMQRIDDVEASFNSSLLVTSVPMNGQSTELAVRNTFDWRNGSNISLKTENSASKGPYYIGFCGENPGIQIGTPSLNDKLSIHVLIGTF